MTHGRSARLLLVGLVGAGALLPATISAAPAGAAAAAAAEEACSPTAGNRPVCAADAADAEASFLDPTAGVTSPEHVELEGQVYVGPFARLLAEQDSPIVIGPESNVQDSVIVNAVVDRTAAEQRRIARAGLSRADGIQTGERVILAHGSSVHGPARLGVLADGEEGPAEDSGVFVSFGARVDGAIIERDSGLSALSRVGPGVTLRSGLIVLPGKDVQTQAEADDPALGKVRPITEADRLFNEGVVEVNIGLAREYTDLSRDDASAVRGINVDPGGNEFDESRDAATVESALCTGPAVTDPSFRNRIIGNACFEDSHERLGEVMGERISIRADEGGPFGLGPITRMDDKVVFHALEGADLRVGSRVSYGENVIVHGGGRPAVDPTTGLSAPTLIGNDVTLAKGAVVFRSLVRNGSSIGRRSAVVGSELALGQRIPDRTIYANDVVFGRVEW